MATESSEAAELRARRTLWAHSGFRSRVWNWDAEAVFSWKRAGFARLMVDTVSEEGAYIAMAYDSGVRWWNR